MPPKASTAACAIASVDSGGAHVDDGADRLVALRDEPGSCLVGRVARSTSATTTDGARLAQRLGVDDADAAGAAGDDATLPERSNSSCS